MRKTKIIKNVAISTSLVICSIMSVGFTFPNNPSVINLCIDDIGGETDSNPATKTNCGKAIIREDRQIEEDRVSANRASETINANEGEDEAFGEG